MVPIDDRTARAGPRAASLDAEDWGRAPRQPPNIRAALGRRLGDPRGPRSHRRERLPGPRRRLSGAGTDVPLGTPVCPRTRRIIPAPTAWNATLQDLPACSSPIIRTRAAGRAIRPGARNEYPAARDFPVSRAPTRDTRRAPRRLPLRAAQGSGVYEIPVGPVHAGIIEPGHFRFQAVGEEVLNLEQRLGYVHKGIEKIAVGRDAAGLARLAGRVSGDSHRRHTWAACQAMEQAAGCEVPTTRELPARADGRARAHRQPPRRHRRHLQRRRLRLRPRPVRRLREAVAAPQPPLFGHRLLMDCVVPGGVASDLDVDPARTTARGPCRCAVRWTPDPILDENPSLDDRLITTGFLSGA
jgi:hypothetical protein